MMPRSLPFPVSARTGSRFACAWLLTATFACAPTPQAAGSAAPTAPASPSSQAATPAAPAAAPAGVETQRKGLASVFVVHKMSDFEAFRKYFEEGAAERAKAGVKGHLLTRLDDGRAVVHFFGDDVAVVEKTLRSPEMEKYVDRKGAPESTLLWLTRDVFVKLPPAPVSGETFSLFLKVETDDLPALENALLESGAKFAADGVVAYGLHQTTTKDSVAIAHFVGTDKQRLAALPEKQEFRDLLARTKSRGSKALIGVDLSRSRSD